MKKARDRIISFIGALTMLLNVFVPFFTPATTYAANKVENDFIDSQILLVDKGKCGRLIVYDGEEIEAKFVVYEGADGKEYPGYCNESSWQGVGSNGISYGEYIVTSKVTDDRLWRVATAGYPYKTPSEMGVNGIHEAFMATKMAVYRILDGGDLDKFTSLNQEGENTIRAIKNLYDIGMNGDSGYVEPELTITAETSETVLDEDNPQYKSQVFTVEGNCEFDTYEVVFDLSDLPNGTKITDIDGIEKTEFDSDENFKVMIPINENDITAFKLNVKAELKSNPVYHAECENIRMQTMLIAAYPYETVSSDVTVKLNKTEIELTIVKKDSVTGEGLANAVFEVNKVDGKIVGTYTTDNRGEVVVPVSESGYYKIIEVQAPDGYLLGDITEQIIDVQFNIKNEVVFLNDLKAGLEIVKIDKDTGKPLENVRFRVSLPNGSIVGEYTTNSKGIINIQDLMPGWYDVEEIEPATNYLKDTDIHKIEIVENEVTTLTLTNKKLTGIQIIKTDSLTEKPLANATFEITLLNSEYSDKTFIGDFTTDESGTVIIPNLYPGMYSIKEISAPRGYNIDVESKLIEVTINNDAIVELTNTSKAGIQIKKIDEDTKEPIKGARFLITTVGGQVVGEYETSHTGFINVPELDAGIYIISETYVPDPYILDNTPKTIEVRENMPTIVEFTNRQKGGVQILKVDEVTGAPLANAKFRVQYKNGALIGEFETDKQGHINLQGLENGWITILEIEAPKGYILDDVKKDIEITPYETKIVEFTNRAKSGLQIKKVDYNTNEPLAGVKFRISTIKNKLIGEYETDRSGFINIPELDEGYYLVQEIRTLENYELETTVKTVEVKSNEICLVEFTNKQLGGIQIIKIDEFTKKPLQGAKFKVTTKNGDYIGEYETDSAGSIIIPNLKSGWYSITETEAPKGYILDDVKQDVEVKYYKNSVVEFTNKMKAGIQIIKTDSVTKNGLADVKFKVTKLNGELVGIYITDNTGIINITDLEEGWFVVQELSTVDGYKLDSMPRNIEVKSNQATVVEFVNEPYATLVIEKQDSVTLKGIAGVQFEVTRENGEFIGKFKTDAFGQIKLSKTLSPDTYIVKELSTIDGYKIDNEPQKVTLNWGETKYITIKNNPYGSLKVTKIDSDTKEKLEGVKYRLENYEGDLVGKYVTNENGQILIEKKLEEGIYYLTEISTLEGYIKDSERHKVTINWGKVTSIELKNTKIMGKIQIVKKSLDNNSYNGDLAGTLLNGAVFEIRDENNKLVDTITTKNNGTITSKSLNYGKYTITEISAPKYYLKSDKVYQVEITEENRTPVIEVYNESVKLATNVMKTGVRETQCLDEIRYDFSNIANASNVSLDNFVWHDSLPIETKIQRIYTGTWNENLIYKVSYKTNFDSTYRVFKDNLFTNQNYELDFTTVALQTDEYITDFIFEFGTVKAGFSQVESPFIFVKVNNYLKNGTEFINYTEVQGYYNQIKITATDSWKTTIYNYTLPVKLPKTGK